MCRPEASNCNAAGDALGRHATPISRPSKGKDSAALREALEESQRPRFGRKARIAGTVEQIVLPPAPSVARLVRKDRKRAAPKTS